MTFICYPKCKTCQKAQRWLDDHGVIYAIRDIKADKPSYEELRTWYGVAGLPLKRFFNTSGLLYKSLGLKQRLDEMSEDEKLTLLASDGMLVKRPIIITDSKILVGFDEAGWSQVLFKK